MFVNEKKNEIVVTKAEYTKAMRVGSDEFNQLFQAKQLFPTAKVVIKKVKNQDNYSKLRKAFMLDYVKATDPEYYEELSEMFKLIGTERFDETKNKITTFSFFNVRDAFLNRYPQFMNESDRKKYDEAQAAEKKSEENTNVVAMKKEA